MMGKRDLQKIGAAAYASIENMVEAMRVDYDRLNELRYRDNDDDDSLDNDEVVELLDLEDQAGECESLEDAEEAIWNDALDIEVREDWHAPGAKPDKYDCGEFRILLTTGGPATRVVGTLDGYKQPTTAHLEAQDWFQPWTPYEGGDEGVLLEYCARFYFGE